MNFAFSELGTEYSQYFTQQSAGPEVLTVSESVFINNAVEKRKIEFSTGRFCAKKALELIGLFDAEILVGSNRQPVWPAGIVGSISHSESITGAVAGYADKVFSVGIDIEKIAAIKVDMWDLLYTIPEQQFLSNVPANNLDLFTTLIFSLKESFYKFQYPVTGAFLDFKDVELTYSGKHFALNMVNKSVDIKKIQFERLNLKWEQFHGHVITLCTLHNR